MFARILELIGLRGASFESWSVQVEEGLDRVVGCRILETEEDLEAMFADGMTPEEAVDFILESEGVDLKAIRR